MAEEGEALIYVENKNYLLCQILLNDLKGQNDLLFSPLILHTFLLMSSQDPSYDNDYNKLKKMMKSYHHDNVPCYCKFLTSLRTLDIENLSVTSKFFIKDNRELQNTFQNLSNKFYYDIETTDLNDSENAAKHINSFTENCTNGCIKHLITSTLEDTTRLALLNTLHFKEKWGTKFNLNTNPTLFHVNADDHFETQMMSIRGEFNCKFDDDMKFGIIEIPLSSDDLELTIIWREKGRELESISNLWSNWYRTTQELSRQEVEVTLPKIRMEQLLNAREILKNYDLSEEFADKAALFGMLDSEILSFSQINKKGFISIDEEGIEVASGLAVTMLPKEFNDEVISDDGLKMSEMSIKTTVSNRFAKTLVTCSIQNNNNSPKEATFDVTLPETAFITEFIMKTDGKSYKSYIKRKEEAKNIYNEALTQGKSAGIVEADTRNSTKFTVSVNLQPKCVAVFLLTYEEMLQRIHDQYELVLNICPGQIVENLNIEVDIKESRPLRFVKTPALRSGKEMNPLTEKYLTPSSVIEMVNSNTSLVKYKVDVEQQKKLCCYLNTPMCNGFSGQFVVQYDVERDPQDGEILLQDGYFVHFFAPNDLDPLPKHAVFVLDTSSSMWGRKIAQLKEAMMSILSELKKGDLITIIEFNQNVTIWDIQKEEPKTISCNRMNNFEDPFTMLSEVQLPSPTFVDEVVVKKAKNVVQKIYAQGSTFMIGGLEMALYMVKIGQEKIIQNETRHQPVMVFLTDGLSNVGSNSTSYITKTVTELNLKHNQVPIFSLSFGEGADKSFLRELSLQNFGFSRHIYESSDASLQLQSFYKQISSPLLADINFKYESDVTELTRSRFPIFFQGSELVISGRCKDCLLPSTINGFRAKGLLSLGSAVKNPVTSLERLWAYLSVKQLLDDRCIAENNEELTRKAEELALKYSFVTEVTSIVVVKPDEDCCAGTASDQITGDDLPEILTVEEEGYKPESKIEKPKDLKFLADHPFLVVLTLKRGDRRVILFIGWINKPLSS